MECRTSGGPNVAIHPQIESHRPSEISPAGPGRAQPPDSPPSGPLIWALSGWIGLTCGLIESAVRWIWQWFEHRFAGPDLWVNWQAPWMVPASLAIGFVGFGLVLGLARGILPRITANGIPRLLIALGTWSFLGVIPGLHPLARDGLALIVGVKVGRLARFDSSVFRRFASRSTPALAAIWMALFIATGLAPSISEDRALRSAPRPAKAAENVLLVVLDTVRADNLSLQGYDRPTSPHLNEWARRGIRFDQARATSPYTLGTHASLFTGHWPSATSARVNAPLDGERATLAEHLGDRGYATGGFVGNIFYGSAHYGLDRGFLHYLDIPDDVTRRATPREFLRSSRLGESLLIALELRWKIFKPMERLRLHGDELNREALSWVDRLQRFDRPFFLFVNYFDAHSPYSLPDEAPQPYSRLTADRLEARMKRLERAEERWDADPSGDVTAEVARLQLEVNGHLRDAYDDGISWVDRKLDELLRGLENRGLLENTLVVVTADHGEMLGEHEVIGHGKSLHRQVVHVPLVVIDPRGMRGQAGRVVSDPVSVRDVPATILDLIGNAETTQFPGRSLGRYWSDDPEPSADAGSVLSEMEHLSWRPHTSRTPAASGPLRLLTEGRWSYHHQDHESLGVLEQLFDLVVDPDETCNLAADPAYLRTLESLRKRFQSAQNVH
jgi:arylsulfatase A-like enzyme